MSGPRITDAAVEAVRDAVEREMRSRTYDRHAYDEEVFTEGVADIADAALTAALPHIRRAVIEELVEKAETEKYPDTYGAFRRAARFHIVEWLRAELEGGDRG